MLHFCYLIGVRSTFGLLITGLLVTCVASFIGLIVLMLFRHIAKRVPGPTVFGFGVERIAAIVPACFLFWLLLCRVMPVTLPVFLPGDVVSSDWARLGILPSEVVSCWVILVEGTLAAGTYVLVQASWACCDHPRHGDHLFEAIG